jgi:hypothetical protein
VALLHPTIKDRVIADYSQCHFFIMMYEASKPNNLISGDVGGESVALEVRYKYPFHTLSDYVRILVLDSIFFLIVFHR